MNIQDLIITDIKTTFPVTLAQKERREIIHRNTYGLTLAVCGEIVYTLKKKEHISNPDYLLLLPKGQSYSLRCTESGLFPVVNFELVNSQSFTQMMAFPISHEFPLYPVYQELEALTKINDPKKRLHKLSLFYQLLSQAIIPNEQEHASPKRRILQPAIDYLENHYDDSGLDNLTLARQSHISEVYFRKLFKEECGLSPKQYIQQLRINKAKELLRSGYLTVSAISEIVGYSGIYHFSKAFKAQTGYSPTEYQINDR
jgi:AraC-like DNA-binding protein